MAGGARRTTLPKGIDLEVRPVAESDLGGLEALYEGLDDEARHRRFFSIYHPPASFFEKLVTIRERGGLGLVAVVRDEHGAEQLVGEAGYEPLEDGDGELGIAVDRGWRGWLGPYLLDALLEAAAEEGVPNLEADVLCSNLSMLTLLRCRGYALMPRDDWTVVRLVVKAGDRGTPSWPGDHDEPHLLVEGAGGSWAGVVVADAAGVEVIGCPGPDAARADCPVLRGEPCPLVAEADAILLRRPGDSEGWEALRAAHARLHPEVPVLVDLRSEDRAQPSEVDVTGHRADAVLVEMARQVRARRPARDATTPRRGPSPLPSWTAWGHDGHIPEGGAAMHAQVGDRIVIVGHRVGEHERDGEILEVRGPDGTPPYVVRWGDTGHEGLFFPGSDARIVHYEHPG